MRLFRHLAARVNIFSATIQSRSNFVTSTLCRYLYSVLSVLEFLFLYVVTYPLYRDVFWCPRMSPYCYLLCSRKYGTGPGGHLLHNQPHIGVHSVHRLPAFLPSYLSILMGHIPKLLGYDIPYYFVS